MQGSQLAPWEVRSAILSGRAVTLRAIATDTSVTLTEVEREALWSAAAKLTAEAHAVVRRG